jgi:hypothetical protein
MNEKSYFANQPVDVNQALGIPSRSTAEYQTKAGIGALVGAMGICLFLMFADVGLAGQGAPSSTGQVSTVLPDGDLLLTRRYLGTNDVLSDSPYLVTAREPPKALAVS